MTADNFKELRRTTKFADASMAHMRNCGISAVPDNFRVWFEYFSGGDPELKKTLDSIIDSKVELKGGIHEEIYRRLFGDERGLDKADEWSRRIEEVAGEFLGAFETTGKETADYGAALRGFSGDLSGLEDFEDTTAVESLVAGVLDDTKAMTAQMERLRAQVTSSTDEIAALKRELETTRRDALTDGLTGVANRKCFDDTLRRAVAAADETQTPLTLVLIDLDHFKALNDTHGHQVGDQVLKVIARTLTQCVKGRDTVARYGGEEFAVILPDTRAADGATVAENIRKTISSRKLRKKGSDTEFGPVTASFGVGNLVPGEDLADLIERTDRALYEAKASGRNRVVSEPSTDLEITG